MYIITDSVCCLDQIVPPWDEIKLWGKEYCQLLVYNVCKYCKYAIKIMLHL